jgi:hypothetical protein
MLVLKLIQEQHIYSTVNSAVQGRVLAIMVEVAVVLPHHNSTCACALQE